MATTSIGSSLVAYDGRGNFENGNAQKWLFFFSRMVFALLSAAY